MKHKRNPEAGFTLVELMIAAGILAVALVFTFGSIISVAESSSITESRSAATARLASIMDELRDCNPDDLLAYQPPPEVAQGFPGHALMYWMVCVDAGGQAMPMPVSPTSLSKPLPNPLEIRIIVAWEDETGHAMTEQVSALFGR